MIGRRSTLLHVLAVGYMADGDEGRNSRLGLGSKPQGGMASAPVANIRMSANRSLASPSEKFVSVATMAEKRYHQIQFIHSEPRVGSKPQSNPTELHTLPPGVASDSNMHDWF